MVGEKIAGLFKGKDSEEMEKGVKELDLFAQRLKEEKNETWFNHLNEAKESKKKLNLPNVNVDTAFEISIRCHRSQTRVISYFIQEIMPLMKVTSESMDIEVWDQKQKDIRNLTDAYEKIDELLEEIKKKRFMEMIEAKEKELVED